jgi:hypothetical protein
MGHVSGEEKYECVMLNVEKMWFKMGVGSVYYVFWEGSCLGIRYLYL